MTRFVTTLLVFAALGTALPAASAPLTSVDVSTIDHFGWSPVPMAATGSLPAGNNALVTVTPYDGSGNPLPGGATVYLSLTGPGSFHAPISCGSGVYVGATPVACHTDTATGSLQGTYTAPSTLPDGGTATLTAAADSSGSNAASDTYTYASFPGLTIVKACPKASGSAQAATETIPNPTSRRRIVRVRSRGQVIQLREGSGAASG